MLGSSKENPEANNEVSNNNQIKSLTVLSDLIKGISAKGTQVIISTQSVPLIENFTINDIIIVEKEGKKSIFKRPDMEFLKEWIDEYTLGELWEMNLLGGRP